MPAKKKPAKSPAYETFPTTLKPYWRYEYNNVIRETGGTIGSPFLGLKEATSAREQKKRRIVVRGTHACLILNIFPYSSGHMLAIPYRQVALIEDLTDEETLELQHLIATAKLLLQKVLKAEAFNIGLNQGEIAGGSVPTHLHWHIVPRWQGDHNFMPVIGRTRLLGRSLDMVWEALTKAYKSA